MSEITLKVIGLIQGTTDGNYSLLLQEEEGERRLPILIGAFEAQAVALAIEKKELKRPLTHDLLERFIDIGGVKLQHLSIHSLIEGVFQAHLLYKHNKKEDTINCRPSDGIVLALKYDLPIRVTQSLLQDYGIIMDEPLIYEEDHIDQPGRPQEDLQPQTAKSFEDLLHDFSKEQLEKMLIDAEANEDYEKAAKIRDELNKR